MVRKNPCPGCDGEGSRMYELAKEECIRRGGRKKELPNPKDGFYYEDSEGRAIGIKTIGGPCRSCLGTGEFNLQVRRAYLLMKELRESHGLQWYYISMVHTASNRFLGGFLLQARGSVEANSLLHLLNLYEKGCETMTHGPIDEEVMKKIPENLRWRKLNKAEAESLGS